MCVCLPSCIFFLQGSSGAQCTCVYYQWSRLLSLIQVKSIQGINLHTYITTCIPSHLRSRRGRTNLTLPQCRISVQYRLDHSTSGPNGRIQVYLCYGVTDLIPFPKRVSCELSPAASHLCIQNYSRFISIMKQSLFLAAMSLFSIYHSLYCPSIIFVLSSLI